MDIRQLLENAVREEASDVFIISKLPITLKIKGDFRQIGEELVTPGAAEQMIGQIYELAHGRSLQHLRAHGDDDFSFSISGLGRFRANAFSQRGSMAVVLRIISFDLPDPQALGIPEVVMNTSNYSHGLVLVTGPAGSGKSTTLANIINRINETRKGHIITMEDPLEYIHKHKQCIVSQREIPTDTDSYVTALRAALRQSPDVLLLGEMRDLETIEIAMTAAETGLLVFSTLHTMGAANTVDRIIDVFPVEQQRQIRTQLSMVLRAVVSQQLLPGKDGELLPAFEVMLVNLAIQNMIREEKIFQIGSAIYSGMKEGMIPMDVSILELYKKGLVDKEAALTHSLNYKMMEDEIAKIG
ncbi:MAG: type IV pilus twitching motility protein PilT [Christensenellaceae bacterium]|jgi:twitching motility protein PilT